MDINEIQRQIKDLQSSITKNHEKLKVLVNDLYKQEKPFPSNRVDDENSDNFADDVTKLKELIAYSILIGDTNLIERWAIIPLRQGELPLVRSNAYFKDYLDEFTETPYGKNISNDFHRFLVNQLLDALKVFAEKKGILL